MIVVEAEELEADSGDFRLEQKSPGLLKTFSDGGYGTIDRVADLLKLRRGAFRKTVRDLVPLSGGPFSDPVSSSSRWGPTGSLLLKFATGTVMDGDD